MPSVESLAAFSLASLLLILLPGPSVLFVIGRSLAHGHRGGLLSVLGNELGALPLLVAVAFGLGAIVAESVLLFTIVKLLGAAYLVYLGIQTIRHRGAGLGQSAGGAVHEDAAPWVTLRQGFVVGVSNPKTTVFFVAVLPQFVNFHAGSVPLQMLVLGLAFVVIALVCDSTWAIAAGAARHWFASSPKRLSAIRASGGGMMVGLGGALALTGSKA
ncbi:LysE family translocator [Zhihengliuella salsuginis]|uniref:Translocator n=1 Tax=Zhihengliuella salsuginis TaxID=578222 RepID=A0ABQ3GJG4_9MICC|nr:LysE family translocator [Zhihengliuella salsuginis]GHD07884.1 putative translocator [Zhihengliuella salsuginis]